MSKRIEAVEILKSLGFPRQQQNERSALTLLALAGLQERSRWAVTKQPLLRIVDIMSWMREKYGKDYAPNSRETIRRQTIHQFEQARIVDRNPDDPKRATNSGDTNYQLNREAVKVLRAFGTDSFSKYCEEFLHQHGTLTAAYSRSRNLLKVGVTLPNGNKIELSPGVHNVLQKHVLQEFAPRFAPGCMVLYVGDTAEKRLVVATEKLKELGIPVINHDKLPDVVLYDENKQWLFLIEAVTSHGPVSPKRHAELESTLMDCKAGRVYVTAFLDFSGFKKYASEIVWESEVWIADVPDHMIHFNGDKFLGPYPTLKS